MENIVPRVGLRIGFAQIGVVYAPFLRDQVVRLRVMVYHRIYPWRSHPLRLGKEANCPCVVFDCQEVQYGFPEAVVSA